LSGPAKHYGDGTKEDVVLRVNVYGEHLLNARLRLIGVRQPSSPTQPKTSTRLICSLELKTFYFLHLSQ